MAGLFREYDIRGIYGKEITEKFAYVLGKALLEHCKPKKIIIGYDSRIGDLKLFSAISKAIIEQGINVVHAGIVTRPMLNWVAWKEKYDLGIMITASHNPKEYNGFKFILHGKQLHYSNGLKDIESIVSKIKSKKFPKKKRLGKIVSIDYIDKYVKFLSSQFPKSLIKSRKNLRVVADASNGSAGEIIKRLLLKNGFTFKLLNDEPDGNFPSHNPDPLHAGSMDKLRDAVIKFKADIGFVVDPDADRIKFVDENGDVVSNNYVDSLIVDSLPKGSSVVYDITSRKILVETIASKKLKGIVSKVGTSNIIENMINSKAVFGCETSGHRYYKLMNNQDSGLMTFVQVASLLKGRRLSVLLKKYHKYVDLGQINYPVKGDKSNIIKHVRNVYASNSAKISDLDGIFVSFKTYWFTLRASNTENLIRLRIEGLSHKVISSARKDIERLIKNK